MPPSPAVCPLCGGRTQGALVTRDHNRGVDRRPFRYHRCVDCGCLSLADPPEDIGSYYPDTYFELPTLDELRRHAATERYRLDMVRPYVPGGRLVEVGPGNGIFAVQCMDAGYETSVVEMSPDAVAHLRDVVGLDAHQSEAPEAVLPTLPASDAVVGWHVLEHLRDPWSFLRAAADNLRSGGVLVLATPNPRALGFRLLRARWPHVDAPRHMHLIDHEALTVEAAKHGLERVALTDTDQGGRHWNAFSWHYLLRGHDAGYFRDGAAHRMASLVERVLAPVERRGLRGAAYTVVLRKR